MSSNGRELFAQRLAFTGSIDEVVDRVSKRLNLGSINSIEAIEIGFQDFNVKLVTSRGCFLIKIFSKERNHADIRRYVLVMEAAIEAGIHHPTLIGPPCSNPVEDEVSGLSMVIMDFIHGRTFYDMQRAPNPDELDLIAQEAVQINNLNIRPEPVFDPWAIPHIEWMYKRTSQFMPEDNYKLAETALQRFKAIEVAALPRCFVHGDIIKTNTIVDKSGKVFILDFAVSNIYPRIQELAVIAANLLYDGKTMLSERLASVIDAYCSAGGNLSTVERSSLNDYAIAALAMEMMGGYYEKFISKTSTAEVDFWINVGTEGLRNALNQSR